MTIQLRAPIAPPTAPSIRRIGVVHRLIKTTGANIYVLTMAA